MDARRMKMIRRLFCAVFAVTAVLFVWNRSRFGLDVTDESFYIGEPYLLLKGSVPFATLWGFGAVTNLLTAPFLLLYELATGGTEGIVLYFVHAAVFYRAAVALGIWFLLRRDLGKYISAVLTICLFCCDMTTAKGLNYNLFSLSLLMLSGAIVFRGLQEPEIKTAWRIYMLAGVSMARCALGHIVQIVNCFSFAVLLFFLEHRKFGKLPVWISSIFAGLSIALAVFIGLEIAGHGGVFTGLEYVFQYSNYLNTEKSGFSSRLFFLLALLLAICIFLYLTEKNGIMRGLFAALRKYGVIASIVFSCAYLIASKARGVTEYYYQKPILLLFMAVIFVPLLLPSYCRTVAFRLILCFWFPSFVYWIAVSSTGTGGGLSRTYGLFPSALLLIPLLHTALRENLRENGPHRPDWFILLARGLPYCLGICFACFFLSSSYAYVYRDAPVSQLTYQVESGVYRGMYTLPERGKSVERLEQSIRSAVSPRDAVLFSDLFPMGYVMTDANPCTPSTWDPTYYRYGFQDMAILQAYFDETGRTPDKIIYVNSEGRELSIDDPRSELAAFVREHYVCTQTVGEGLFSFRVFETRRGSDC